MCSFQRLTRWPPLAYCHRKHDNSLWLPYTVESRNGATSAVRFQSKPQSAKQLESQRSELDAPEGQLERSDPSGKELHSTQLCQPTVRSNFLGLVQASNRRWSESQGDQLGATTAKRGRSRCVQATINGNTSATELFAGTEQEI